MRSLWPRALEPVDLYAAYTRASRPLPRDRPWIAVVMIAAVDGSVTDASGRSGGLGNAGDRAVFRAMRAAADVVLAGAGTVRAEDYGPVRIPPSTQAQRRAQGQSAKPRLAIVSRSLDLGPHARLFHPDDDDLSHPPPLVLTVRSAPIDRRKALAEVAEIEQVGDVDLDWSAALEALATRGASLVVVEGGPTINAQLIAEDLVDELCLTVAPLLTAGDGGRIASGPPSAPRSMRLAHVLEQDDYLYLRYVRTSEPSASPAQ